MRIDRKQLVERLVSATGLDPAEAEQQLDRSVEELERKLQQGEPAEIGSFGKLEREGDEISFYPSSVLATELNRKYAGMEPIELIGAFRRRVVAAAGEDAHDGHVVEADQPKPSLPEMTESPDPGDLLPERDKILVRETVAKMVGGGDSSDNSDESVDGKGMREEPVRETEDNREPADRPRPEKRPRKAKTVRRSDPIGTFITAAVIILLVLVGGWFAYDYGFNRTDGAAESSVSGSETTTDTDPPQAAGSEDPGPGTESAGGDAGNTGDEDRWGLTGPATAAGGYTIVVYSLNTEEVARELEDTLIERDYRVIVRQATVGGTRFWRVGIGQFETVPDAQEAVGELPEPYRTNHFIRRIQ